MKTRHRRTSSIWIDVAKPDAKAAKPETVDLGDKFAEACKEAGGYPTYAAAHRETSPESEPDGIPAEWKVRHNLDPQKPLEAQTPPASGYTWLEEYLNDLAAKATR